MAHAFCLRVDWFVNLSIPPWTTLSVLRASLRHVRLQGSMGASIKDLRVGFEGQRDLRVGLDGQLELSLSC